MDIQKEEKFEALPEIEMMLRENPDIKFENGGYVYHGLNQLTAFAVCYVAGAWMAWQAAKAQAVPETQQALNDRLLVKSIREHVESHIDETSVNDLFDKGWLAAMKCIQNNIDMLEAQEPAND